MSNYSAFEDVAARTKAAKKSKRNYQEAEDYLKEAHGIKVSFQTSGLNPFMKDSRDKFNFCITFVDAKDEIAADSFFSQSCKKPWGKHTLPAYEVEKAKLEGQNKYPDLWSYLHCIASDCMGIECRSFKDWADDYGYDSDSISAKNTFDVITEQREDFSKFFGDFQELWNYLEENDHI